MKAFQLLLTILITSISLYAQPLALTATQVAGSCSSNAQINANATGGSIPYQYRLTAGAAGINYPTFWQSRANFSGLKPGAYIVQVQDDLGTISNRNVTVTSTYVSLTINTVTNTPNNCPSSPTGTITTNASRGRTPYSYRLLQGTTVIKNFQASNIFTAVSEGNYTVEVTDACGEIRTFATTVALTDFKWNDIKNHDNGFINSGYSSGYPAFPFDTTKFGKISDGPLQFSCDSIAFRIFNTLSFGGSDLPARGIYRRVYIKDLTTNTIFWDYTYRPSDWPGGYTSPSVRLKINKDYRFYFDDLCNDIDSIDRNYNYPNTNNYTISSSLQKVCGGYNLLITRPSNWNTKNRYNSAYDTITIVSSTFPGDTLVGKHIIENFANISLSEPLVFNGATPGNSYSIEVKTVCGSYTRSMFVNSPAPLTITASVASGACKLNTASLRINVSRFPVTPGKMIYRINSGPASFIDVKGNTFPISYPIIDSFNYTNRIDLRNFPPGSYSIDFWDQCGNAAPTTNINITDAQTLKLSGSVSANQQCSGASTLTYNNIYNQHFSGNLLLLRKNNFGVYLLTRTVDFNSTPLPSSYSFTGLSDGDYRVVVLANSWTPLATPIPSSTCDTLFTQDISLLYQLPVVDTAEGFACTAVGNTGKIILVGKGGVRPYEFQRLDASGNAITPYQKDSIFTGLARGLYSFRIKDNCGNATLYSYQIDTLKNPAISSNGFCYNNGSSLLLTTDSIYNAMYTWSFQPFGNGVPNIVGNSRTHNNLSITASDYGIYTVTYTKPGCINAKSASINVTPCTVLPLKLTSFIAKISSTCERDLFWTTESEKDIADFVVQQSTDGITWKNLGFVTSEENYRNKNDYHYHIKAIYDKADFYRLQINETTGSHFLSNIITATGNCISSKSSTAYPNPAKDIITITLTGYSNTVYGKAYDNSGQLMYSGLLNNGSNRVNVSKLPSGIYHFVILEREHIADTHTIIIK